MSFAQGKYINFGYDPNNSKIGLQYVNGSQISIINRENTKLTVQMKDTLDANGKKTNKISKITYQIKDQATTSKRDCILAEKQLNYNQK